MLGVHLTLPAGNGERDAMKILLLSVAIVFLTGDACLAGSPYLVAPNGQYLGNLNANPNDPNSVHNPNGMYGSPNSPYSATNPNAPGNLAPHVYGGGPVYGAGPVYGGN